MEQKRKEIINNAMQIRDFHEKNIILFNFITHLCRCTFQVVQALREEAPETDLRRACILLKPAVVAGLELQDVANSRSSALFTYLQLDSAFLKKDPSEWANDESFKFAREIVHSLHCTNDTAERGVKLMQEYIDCLTTSNESRRERQNHDNRCSSPQALQQMYQGRSCRVLKLK